MKNRRPARNITTTWRTGTRSSTRRPASSRIPRSNRQSTTPQRRLPPPHSPLREQSAAARGARFARAAADTLPGMVLQGSQMGDGHRPLHLHRMQRLRCRLPGREQHSGRRPGPGAPGREMHWIRIDRYHAGPDPSHPTTCSFSPCRACSARRPRANWSAPSARRSTATTA